MFKPYLCMLNVHKQNSDHLLLIPGPYLQPTLPMILVMLSTALIMSLWLRLR